MATVCPIKKEDGSANLDYTVTDDYLLSEHSYGANYKNTCIVKCARLEDAVNFLKVLYTQKENVITLNIKEG
tara:strand:- start:853 stop:1068 length:216 start_codon:yes stop_codon:yes gene_type:complete